MNHARWTSLITLICLLGHSSFADETSRIDQLYSSDVTSETPDFRRDVVPLLGKLGCNGRACHGSFQGQGGFRLSLFGYDFKADHEMLTGGDKPRVHLEAVADSLILKKPLEIVPHEGGSRLTAGTWQHRVLTRWIEAGAKPIAPAAAEFVRLEVTPAEIVATRRGEQFSLKAVAVWSDGMRQDVTPLCRFRTNNDQIATIDDAGLVTSAGPGDSHVVVFYDNGVVPVPVIQPVSSQFGPHYPAVATPTRIDELVVQKLRKLGVVPSGQCSDAEFLRRVSLDLIGTLPDAAEVETFLADTSANKHAAKIDELLERPAYAAWWATRFADWTGNNTAKLNDNKSGIDANTKSTEWYEWLRTRIEKNVPYDQLAEGIILAVSRLEGEDYAAYCDRVSHYYHKEPTGRFADQPSLTHYWTRRDFLKPDERALGFAYSFLGLRIQCAQCHKHPFDQWTKDDFDRFKEFFARAKYGPTPGTKDDSQAMLEKAGIDFKKLKGNELGKAIREHLTKSETMPFDELFVAAETAPKPKKDKKRPQVVAGRTAKILGGDEVKISEMADPREALMDWLRDEHNPYFARAIVNRIWAGYFNVGIVEPVDDLSLANPPSNEALLNYLASEFRSHGYDLKWLHRTIASSATYQRSWRVNETNPFDDRNFARAVPRRIPAEVTYDALQHATMNDADALKWRTSTKGRAIANPIVNARGGRGADAYALTVFGRSNRESNCECDRSTEASLLQAVYLRNDGDVLAMIDGKGRWLDQIVTAKPSPSPSVVSDGDKTRRQERFAQLTTGQLKRRREAAEKNGRPQVAQAIDAELAARETRGNEEPSTATPSTDPTPVIRQAYLRTLNRYPLEVEVERARRNYNEAGDLAASTKDLLWALLNTKEFLINH